jgi:hypothetical protein
LPGRWRQYVPLKHQNIYPLHDAETQNKIIIWSTAAVKTWKLRVVKIFIPYSFGLGIKFVGLRGNEGKFWLKRLPLHLCRNSYICQSTICQLTAVQEHATFDTYWAPTLVILWFFEHCTVQWLVFIRHQSINRLIHAHINNNQYR